MSIDLGRIPSILHDQAREAFDRGDVMGFLGYTDNQLGLAVVLDNAAVLKARGLYEKALLEAFMMCRVDNRAYADVLDAMFAFADRQRLRDAGDPLPGPGPFVVYRGAKGGRRRTKGMSWTGSLDTACWFAARSHGPGAAIFSASVHAEEVLAYISDRGEDEFVCKPERQTRHRISESEIRGRLSATEAPRERTRI